MMLSNAARLRAQLAEFEEIETTLDPWSSDDPLRPVRPLKESLALIAELFVNKYPNEDAEIVQRLVAMFVDPMERRLVGDEQSIDEPSEG